MQIVERVIDGVHILDLRGKLQAGEAADQLRTTVGALTDAGRTRILLNLGEVPQVDSTGLGEVVRCHTTVERKGGALKLVGVTKKVHDLLSITKLLTLFEIHQSEDEALRSF